MGGFPTSPHVFFALEKAIHRVPHGTLWAVLHECRVCGSLTRQVCTLLPVLFTIFMGRVSMRSRRPERVLYWMLCWLHQVRTFSVCWGSLQLSVKQLG